MSLELWAKSVTVFLINLSLIGTFRKLINSHITIITANLYRVLMRGQVLAKQFALTLMHRYHRYPHLTDEEIESM